jgi:hypothetical protein
MKKLFKVLAVFIVAAFLASLVPMNTVSASKAAIAGQIQGLTHLKPGTSPLLSNDEPPGYDASPFLEGAVAVGAVGNPHPHSPWTVVVLDDYLGGFYYQDFTSVLNGTHCNIWVGLNDTVWTGGYTDEWKVNGPGFADDEFFFALPWSFMYHSFSSRYQNGFRDYITGAQLMQIMDEFDNHIWQTDTSFFGQYAYRPGPFGDGKIQILIFNIRDEFFWTMGGGGFIEGYFWSYASNLNSANIIHIDTHQWFRRQGPSPNGGVGVPLMTTPYTPAQCMPYEYEGTFAHEFQHLIHYDIDPDEYSWVNEGCSVLAQIINGYGIGNDLAYYITDFWETSLTQWEGTLADYGVVGLWTLYMYEHYGGQPFIYALVHEQANGIQGYNNVLKARHICKTFDQIFQDWAMANYLDDTTFARGIYGYYSIDFPNAWSAGYDIPTVVDLMGMYSPYPTYPDGPYTLPERLPYVVWYWRFDDGSPALKVNFNGDDAAGIFPHSATHEWYSDGTAYSWFRLGRTFAIPSTGATLKFWSNFNIEENWDYGYVEVHDTTTDEWYTLPGIKTVSTVLNPEDNPNCPDQFEPWAYLAGGRWNGFTGDSGGWYQEQMDLTPFKGHNIELYFTYWTDPYTLWRGWYVDDVEIPELGFLDNVESGVNGWTVNSGWSITTGVIPNNFEVNFIQTLTLNICKKTTIMHYITEMRLNKAQDGCIVLPAISTKIATFGPSVMVVANQPGFENNFGTYFTFSADIVHCSH